MLLAAAAHAAAANAAAVHSFTSGPTHDAIKFRKLDQKEHMPNNLYPKILDQAARDLPVLPQLPENIIVSGMKQTFAYYTTLMSILNLNPSYFHLKFLFICN